ncbi:MAG: hypothetical protein ABJA81_09630 [Nocardioidaceae bacterium]
MAGIDPDFSRIDDLISKCNDRSGGEVTPVGGYRFLVLVDPDGSSVISTPGPG